MIKSTSQVNSYIIACIIFLILIAGRGYLALGDFSYFFVAGTDFVNPAATPAPVWVQNGQGYDGQFFYRYSLDPFNFDKTKYGVTVDLVPYRMQRIGYPVLCWLISVGGTPWLVPYAMVLVNLLAFFGILFFVNRLYKNFIGNSSQVYYPLLLCGLYMSLGRDLSEVTELFFITAALNYLYEKRFLIFALMASCAILTRETAIITLVPLVVVTIYGCFKNKSFQRSHLVMLLPFVIFAIWKLIIAYNTESIAGASGTGNIGVPFKGLLAGFSGNTDISTIKNKLQLGFWILYFLWQVIFIILISKMLLKSSSIPKNNFYAALTMVWLGWLIFAIFLSQAIYIDDWSFVRVFSLWNMIGFLLLLLRNHPIPPLFRYYSIILVALTVVRLIIRP